MLWNQTPRDDPATIDFSEFLSMLFRLRDVAVHTAVMISLDAQDENAAFDIQDEVEVRLVLLLKKILYLHLSCQ